jgi:hypothetical protein
MNIVYYTSVESVTLFATKMGKLLHFNQVKVSYERNFKQHQKGKYIRVTIEKRTMSPFCEPFAIQLYIIYTKGLGTVFKSLPKESIKGPTKNKVNSGMKKSLHGGSTRTK